VATNRAVPHANLCIWNSAPQINRVYNTQATDHVASGQDWHSQVNRGMQAEGVEQAKKVCDVRR
jgi:hypothetical protein